MMKRSRFSLYCLEADDEYLGDVIADSLVKHSSRSNFRATAPKTRGKLRLSGKTIFFEADEWTRPIQAFRLKDVDSQHVVCCSETCVPQLLSATPIHSDDDSTIQIFSFRCDTTTLMLQNGEWSPFTQEMHTGLTSSGDVHIFCFPFGGAEAFVERAKCLIRMGDCPERVLKDAIERQDQSNPFALSMQKEADEIVVSQTKCKKISPLTQQRGRLTISNLHMYFRPTFPIAASMEVLELRRVRRVERRRWQLMETGLEIVTIDDETLLLAFEASEDREIVFKLLEQHLPLERVRVCGVEASTRRWVEGELSTFDYLMFLNWSSGRSSHDLTQYPVLPWILADYATDDLALDQASSFRDFSKPIGALNPTRLAAFQQRANELRSIGEAPYLFGSHFSTPAYVAYFLVRRYPEFMLVMQSGKLDHPSRMFDSIPECFLGVLTGPTDLKELIPEFFFGDGSFLRGKMDLGTKPDGQPVRKDVVLPPWSMGDPKRFVDLHRQALESEHVSRNIHHWIDLMFGFQLDGADAWAANNVFHPYAYENSLKSVQRGNETEWAAVQMHIQEFGQMPKRLFASAHPQRRCAVTPSSRVGMAPPDNYDFHNALHETEPTIVSTALDIENLLAQETDEDEPHFHEVSSVAHEDANLRQNVFSASLTWTASIRCGSRGRIESLCVVDVPSDADWLFEDYDVEVVSVVFAGDSAGSLFVLDATTGKRIRTIADFPPTTISCIESNAAHTSLLVASNSGSVFDLDLNLCVKRCEVEDFMGASSVTSLHRCASLVFAGTRCGSVGVCVVDESSGKVDLHSIAGEWDVASTLSLSASQRAIIALDVSLDTTGSARRLLCMTTNGRVAVCNLVDHTFGEDFISFNANSLSNDFITAFFSHDHLVTVVSREEVLRFTFDGERCGSFTCGPSCEIAFAARVHETQSNSGSLVVASTDGFVYIVSGVNGDPIGAMRIDDEVLGTAKIVRGAIGSHNTIALADDSGRVHIVRF